MGNNNSTQQCSISIKKICSQIIKNRDITGITKEQISALSTSTKVFPFPEIISAIQETMYYQMFGEITPSSLRALPEQERKPIHQLFAAYYNLSLTEN